MNFIEFKQAVQRQWARMLKIGPVLRTSISKDLLWDTYLSSFPEGTNPIYRERTEHDCNCCKQFIRNIGDAVVVKNGKLVSIWDVELPTVRGYKDVAAAMSKAVKSFPIDTIFLHFEKQVGTDKNFEEAVEGTKTWNHFHVTLPNVLIAKSTDIPTRLGHIRATYELLMRGIQTITPEAVDTVLDLIKQNSLYRGAEFEAMVKDFKNIQKKLRHDPNIAALVWDHVARTPNAAYNRIRNTSIGTLLVDLSDDVDLETAVKSFESKVAPSNYKRPTALVTPKMIAAAKAKVEELGLTTSLARRYAVAGDISINNVLYADRGIKPKMSDNVFEELASKTAVVNPKKLDKVEEVSIEKFLTDIVPTASSIELLVENRHTGNFVSLIAPEDASAPYLFKWANGFSWSYAGNVTDSIKERVKAAGGNVTGELCCRLAWEYTDDLDFYMDEPGGEYIYYRTRHKISPNGGRLDVDANGGNGMMEHPVENIFYNKLSTMRPGTYELSVNNYNRRSTDGAGFDVEIDLLGEVTTLRYAKALRQSETILVASIVKNAAGKVTITPAEGMTSTTASKQVWGVTTQTYVPVNLIMLSPNHWDGQGVGNKHYFFMLNDCANEEGARGFYNEFLRTDLDVHRKVFEMVGAKMQTTSSKDQLSGLGFSSTKPENFIVRVNGSFSRTLRVSV